MDGRDLTRGERRDIRALITNKNPGCANYDRGYGCLPADAPCYMLAKETTGGGVCKYFRDAVLSLNPTLEAVLSHKPVQMKSCVLCGGQFAQVGRQVYCSEKCEREGKRKKDREWRRNYRGRMS